MADHPPRRTAALRRFRRRCWAAVLLCLLAQTGAAAAQNWTVSQGPSHHPFQLEIVQ